MGCGLDAVKLGGTPVLAEVQLKTKKSLAPTEEKNAPPILYQSLSLII